MDKDCPDVAAECLPLQDTRFGPRYMRTPMHSDTLAQTDVAAVWGLLRRCRSKAYRKGLVRPGEGGNCSPRGQVGTGGGAGPQTARATAGGLTLGVREQENYPGGMRAY